MPRNREEPRPRKNVFGEKGRVGGEKFCYLDDFSAYLVCERLGNVRPWRVKILLENDIGIFRVYFRGIVFEWCFYFENGMFFLTLR